MATPGAMSRTHVERHNTTLLVWHGQRTCPFFALATAKLEYNRQPPVQTLDRGEYSM